MTSMKRFRVRAAEVQAVLFNESAGRDIAAWQDDPANEGAPHPSGVTFLPGYGYRLNGQTLSFGQYIVRSHGGSIVMDAKEFDATYEAV